MVGILVLFLISEGRFHEFIMIKYNVLRGFFLFCFVFFFSNLSIVSESPLSLSSKTLEGWARQSCPQLPHLEAISPSEPGLQEGTRAAVLRAHGRQGPGRHRGRGSMAPRRKRHSRRSTCWCRPSLLGSLLGRPQAEPVFELVSRRDGRASSRWETQSSEDAAGGTV